jgi:hypothetical protein
VEKDAFLQSLLLKSPIDSSSNVKFSSGTPTESDVRLMSPPPHILPDPQKIAVIIEVYYFANYVGLQNFIQHPAVKVNSIRIGNYLGSSMWISMHR